MTTITITVVYLQPCYSSFPITARSTDVWYDVLQRIFAALRDQLINDMHISFIQVNGRTPGFHIPLSSPVGDEPSLAFVIHSRFTVCPPHQHIAVAIHAHRLQLKWPLWNQGDVCPINMEALGSSDDYEKRQGRVTGFVRADTNFPCCMVGLQSSGEALIWVNTASYLKSLNSSKSADRSSEILTRHPLATDLRRFSLVIH
jgi:hypothetical protein